MTTSNTTKRARIVRAIVALRYSLDTKIKALFKHGPPVATSSGWIHVGDRLPGAYRDVFVRRSDKTKRIARLDAHGNWQLASYQICKNQYLASDVVAWFDAGADAP